jgi:hypothetical protein
MKNTVIISNDSFITPPAIQNAIITRFAFSKEKEVNVKFNKEESIYDIYLGEKFVCSFDEDGDEI